MSGQLSKAKALAYMYQHAETELMNAIDGFLTERGYEVLARVHDAVFVRRRLKDDDALDLINFVQKDLGNEYFGIKETKLDAFKRPASLDREDLEQHRQRIREETERAENYFSSIY